MKHYLLFLAFIVSTTYSEAQISLSYQEPPEEIKSIADVPPAPLVSVDGNGKNMLIMYRPAYVSIEDLSQAELRIAGLRINPATNGPFRNRFMNDLKLMTSDNNQLIDIQGLPQNPRISDISWSKDYSKIAFTNTIADGIELWMVDVKEASATRVTTGLLNDVFRGKPYEWDPQGEGFICKFVNESRTPYAENPVPTGPVIQENTGTKAPSRTYQDLLKNTNDEAKFEFYSSSKLVTVDFSGNVKDSGIVGIISRVSYSPDGNYVLASEIHKPFSYLVPYYRFPYKTVVYDRSGNLVKEVFDAPLEEDRPKGFMASSRGPRNINWRDDEPSTLYWVEALDEGDPQKEVDFRDAVFVQNAPFSEEKVEIAKTQQRFGGIDWGNSTTAILYDYWWNTRNNRAFAIDPSNPGSNPDMIFDLNTEDLYNNPGSFQMTQNKYGREVLLMSGARTLYLTGEGYSPEGNRPFIDAFDIKTKKKQRLWRAAGETTYERIIEVIDIKKGEILTTVESKDMNPNYYIRNVYKRSAPQQITNFPNPYETLTGVKKEVLKYTREDGTELTAQLYLPAGYKKEDGRLPMLLWAYPREYKDASVAGQVKSSPHTFTRIYYGSPIFWVNRGYAVLDRTDFPIVGEGDSEPNDTFVEQLVANADAAISTVTDMGIADPQRVGVGGHSYGAFMTANLLAHSDLFAGGIARSGAYNRTLTPFGFQREERTFWEAPEIYFRMSPFMHANKINEPILLIHGVADNNSGTFPMQSERMYNAIKGHGGTARLVMLPNESHGYAARESVMHMLWEMDTFLEKYVKNRDKLGENSQTLINKD